MPNLNIIPKNEMDEVYVVTTAAWAHMLSCSLSLVEKTGEAEVNPGIKEAVDNCIQPYLKDRDMFTVKRIATKAAKIGDACLAVVDAKNEVSRTLGVAYAIAKLVEITPPMLDPQSTLAAAALGIIMESDDENDQVWRDARHPKGIAKRLVEKFGEEQFKP